LKGLKHNANPGDVDKQNIQNATSEKSGADSILPLIHHSFNYHGLEVASLKSSNRRSHVRVRTARRTIDLLSCVKQTQI
jgi:hypothetical protein